jgi:hypothetical protein
MLAQSVGRLTARAERNSHKWSGASLRRDSQTRTSQAAGRALTFLIAAGVVLVWALSGPIFHFSDTWQLVINTGTTIVTFLMVFLIQNSQNRDSAAIQVKLDEADPRQHGAQLLRWHRTSLR